MHGYKVNIEQLQILLGHELDEEELFEVEFLENFHSYECTAIAERLSAYLELPFSEVLKTIN